MKLLIATILVLLQLSLIKADYYGYCNTGTFNVTTDTAEIGCNGYNYNVRVTWTISMNESFVFTFPSYSLDSYSSLTIQDAYSTTTYSSSPAPTTSAAYIYQGPITITFSSTYQYNYGFVINLKPAPAFTTLVSGQNIHDTQKQEGGFVYFMLPNQQFGSNLFLGLRVYSYQGLQAPALFVSNNLLPILEAYQYTNQTVASGSDEVADLVIPNPANGNWFVGVFLYGTTADIAIDSQWTYDPSKVVPLVNGVSVTGTVSTTTYYQAVVPSGTASLFLQVSRQVPGGYILVYINAGTVPSASSASYELDTRINSYMTLTIDNPNPANSTAANPGIYIIAVTSASGSAGYIFEASWPTSDQQDIDYDMIKKLY